MQTMNWLESHVGSIDDAIKMLNDDFCWFIDVVEGTQKWFVKSGEKVIFSSDSREAIDAFLYGMGLALNCIPDHLYENLRKNVKEWCDDL